MASQPDIDAVYSVLRSWALGKTVKTYTDLSNEYRKATGVWFEPYRSWDAPLGTVNRHMAGVGLPAISALVVLKEKGEPGGAFWGCAPNVPAKPKGEIERLAEWQRIVKDVHGANWPSVLPPQAP